MGLPDVVDRLLARYPALLARHPSVMQQLAQISGDQERHIKRELQRTDPFESHEARVASAERSLRAEAQTSGQLAQDIDAYAGFLKQTNLASDLVYWTAERKRVESVKSDGDAGEARKARALLVQNWRKKLDQARTAWELQQIRSLRDAYMEDLLQWLAQLELIERTLDKLGIEPGRLLDFSKGTLSPQNMEQLTRWARYLEGDSNVQALCALLGRAWQQERSSKLEKVQRQVTFQTLLPDVHSREELVGIEFGKNVSHAIPAEWMLLADSASETLFDLKLAESRLLCFRMEGMQAVTQNREEEHSVEEKTRGPIIVCVDTSGSMKGAPEHLAKAMALFLALQTQAEGRGCYLINFSTDIDVLDLSDQFGMATLMRFLQMSFLGGTDAAPALDHALEMLRSEHLERADVLVISDFVMAELAPDTLSAIAAQRAHENRFYSLCIGASFPLSRVRDHFDREWMFDPARSSILELFQLRDDMGTRAR